MIDQAEINKWLVIAGTWNIGRAYVRGDTNLDGRVDATDLNTLAMNWQLEDAAVERWGGGDFNGDRVFDSKDLNAIGVNWQKGIEIAAAVPEPNSPVMLLAFLVGLLTRRHSSKDDLPDRLKRQSGSR